MVRPSAIVVAFACIPWTLAVVAGDADPVLSVPVPRSGDRAHYVFAYEEDGQVLERTNLTDTWSGLEVVRDGFDQLRPSYVVERDADMWCTGTYYPCEPVQYRVDPATRMPFEVRGLAGLVLSLGGSRLGPVGSEHYFDFTRDVHTFVHRPRVEWLAQGRTLAPGDTLVAPIGASPNSPTENGTMSLEAHGWEDVEGASLFHVTGRYVSNFLGASTAELWFDGDHPVPNRWVFDLSFTSCSGSSCSHHSAFLVGTLQSFTTGDLPLVAPAVTPVTVRPGAAWVPLGRDGPADLTLSSFPRHEAIDAARGDPFAAAWLEEHPDAYVTSARGREDTDFSQAVSWTLGWSEGRDLLVVEVVRPYALGLAVPSDSVSAFNDTRPFPAPPFESLPTQVACLSQARSDAFDREGSLNHARPDLAVTWFLFTFPGTFADCVYQEKEPLQVPDVEEHASGGVAVTQRSATIGAAVDAFSGAVFAHFHGDEGAVDPFWVDGSPLPDLPLP